MLIEDMKKLLWMSVSVDGHMVDYSHKNVRRESTVKIFFNEEECKDGGVCVHGSGFGGNLWFVVFLVKLGCLVKRSRDKDHCCNEGDIVLEVL